MGARVFNNVVTNAGIGPAVPKAGHSFWITGFQITMTLPQGLATGLAGLSPISGDVTGTAVMTGAAPADAPIKGLRFSVNIKKPVPAPGIRFKLPANPTAIGPCIASSSEVTVRQSADATLTRAVKSSHLALHCTAFPNNTPDSNPKYPWAGKGKPPLSKAISPVIALASNHLVAAKR